jgi:hypothetical protein
MKRTPLPLPPLLLSPDGEEDRQREEEGCGGRRDALVLGRLDRSRSLGYCIQGGWKKKKGCSLNHHGRAGGRWIGQSIDAPAAALTPQALATRVGAGYLSRGGLDWIGLDWVESVAARRRVCVSLLKLITPPHRSCASDGAGHVPIGGKAHGLHYNAVIQRPKSCAVTEWALRLAVIVARRLAALP